MQRQNAELTVHVGSLNRTSHTLSKDSIQIQGILEHHTQQLTRLTLNQEECHATLEALMEMVQALDTRVTKHEESEHGTERPLSRVSSTRSSSDKYKFPPPQRASTEHPKRRPDAPKEAKTKRPDKYEGKKGAEAEDFITRMEIYFLDYPEYFTDQKKIVATLNNTAKTAATWARTYLKHILNNEPHEHLRSWRSFRETFLENFGDVLKKEKAIKSIGELKQTASASSYTTQFRTLAEELGWPEETLIGMYRRGLKAEVLKHLMLMEMGTDQPMTLERTMKFASTLR